MIRFRFDVGAALEAKGINVYVCKKEKILSQDTFRKIRDGNTAVTVTAIDKICSILDVQPGDLIEYVPDGTETEGR